MTNSILRTKDVFFIMLHCLLQVDYVFDFSQRNIAYFLNQQKKYYVFGVLKGSN